jgi:uncharacterized protein HemX
MMAIESWGSVARIVIVIAALVAAFAFGWTVQGWRKTAEIAALKSAQDSARATAAEAAEAQLVDAAAKVHDAAAAANVNIADLGKKLDQIQKEFRNAKPLPADCRPDDFRLQHLARAVDAARAAISGAR